MNENVTSVSETAPDGNNKKRSFSPKAFLIDLLRGCGIGVAFIIPGFSGGSVAAILGIYEKLIGAIADIFKSFKKSFITLLPIALGLVIGAVSLLFPLEWALGTIPLPTVSLFVGLTVGCFPTLTEKIKGKILPTNVLAFIIPMLLSLALCFIPIGADRDLYTLGFGGYVLLFLVGILGSSALVIPGISGSMMLLILGYYNPIVSMITGLIKSVLTALGGEEITSSDITSPLLVLITVGAGIILGFIGISVLMKWLFKKCPRGTYFSIIGFIVGSLPTVYVSTVKEAGYTAETIPTSPIHWIGCVLALAIGVALSFGLVLYSRKKEKAPINKTE
ncbi:MAG: DUF368 domain-containing protein [Clostridia bacterium]|nr:DUF368 domain-containing protein [Clostridia bacterium]